MVIAALSIVTVTAARASDPKSGFVLVANQRSASASLIDLSTDTARIISVGDGPHEAVSLRAAHRRRHIYGIVSKPGNQLAVVDIVKGVVTKPFPSANTPARTARHAR